MKVRQTTSIFFLVWSEEGAVPKFDTAVQNRMADEMEDEIDVEGFDEKEG